MHKWFGEEKPVWRTPVASICVAPGAELNIGGMPRISVAKISGGGTVTGCDFVDVSEIEVACSGGTTAPVALSGSLAFAGAVTVTLTGGVDTLVNGETYPLVTGGTFSGLQGVNWTVAGLPPRQKSKVSVVGGALCLSLVPTGTSIIFR